MATSRSRGSVNAIEQATLWDRMWQPFWVLPVAMTLGALAMALVLPELDKELRGWMFWVFPGGADAARGALTTIASATISTVGVVFSITMVVLQLASSSFTPRILGSFLESRVVQATFGMFIATFVFSLIALRAILNETDDSSGFVPRVSVTFAFLMAIGCVGLFLAFVRHITESIQVSKVISRIGDRTLRLIERVLPGQDENGGAGPTWSPTAGTPSTRIQVGERHGHLDEIDLPELVRLAGELEGVIVLERSLGAFVTHGQPLATFWGEGWDEDAQSRLASAMRLATERTTRQDVSFGFRQLVDIGDRALSPGTNDPTTANQVINELHRLLRVIVQRVVPSPYIADDDGVVRVVAQGSDVETLLTLSVQELAHFARDIPPVLRRLQLMLDDLDSCALPRYQGSIDALRETVASYAD
ncbi:DUF2254 domain-containing protein [Tessaracoccus flavus]|uniref:Uncharacterized protein n=1 Tax=Tessaracoccus flavus TaxID=1610493 RepID=A0A1Q2CH06_9ACTN|nr:DUF2254 domain-containing protein [Tessaracoccus flavus]AQP45401.1 hypothetical protein RPIT_11815 [Tessaracoccus flavus]SDY93128.1 Uncharacterized membrane protein [Tessaracoccus flavus]